MRRVPEWHPRVLDLSWASDGESWVEGVLDMSVLGNCYPGQVRIPRKQNKCRKANAKSRAL